MILMDQEFDKLDGALGLVEINTTAAREHVGEIERDIRTLKERARTITSVLPYDVLPKQMVVHLIYHVVVCLNCMVNKLGISDVLSPREILQKRKLDFKTHFGMLFGSYVEAHEDPDVTNTMRPRTYPAIYLGNTNNVQGTKKVFDLTTGVVKKPRSVTEFPIPDRVIGLVNQWGKRYQKEERENKLEFLNRRKLKFDWDNDELVDTNGLTENGLIEHGFMENGLMGDPTYPDIPAEFPGLELVRELEVPGSAVTTIEESTDKDARNAEANMDLVTTGTAPVIIDLTKTDDADIEETAGVPEVKVEPEDPVSPNVAEPLGTVENDQGHRRSARIARSHEDGRVHLSYRGHKYTLASKGAEGVRYRDAVVEGQAHYSISDSILEAFVDGRSHISVQSYDDVCMTGEQVYEHVLGIVMMQQYSLKAGLNKFGKEGEQAVTKELTQIHELETYVPVDPDKISAENKALALESLLFLVEKRNGKLKSRMTLTLSYEITHLFKSRITDHVNKGQTYLLSFLAVSGQRNSTGP